MIVKVNGMTFDDSDKRCKMYLTSTQATNGLSASINIAFITVVDDSTQVVKKYCGVFEWASKEDCIEQIMEVGGKWPDAFRRID